MAPYTSISWKCSHIRPQDVPSFTQGRRAHVVGPGPHGDLLEIAMLDHPLFNSQYKSLSEKSRVSIESMVSNDLLNQHGPVVAYHYALLDFVENIRKGVANHGISLAEYYRERYSFTTPWIEYILLFDALSKIKIGSNLEVDQQRQSFVKAIVLIVLSVTPRSDPLYSRTHNIDPTAVIERLQHGLEREYWGPQPNPNLIIMVRMLLSAAGATKPVSHMGLLPQQELDLPKAIYQLMGGCRTEDLRSGTPSFIDVSMYKLVIATWSYIPEFPCHLISSLSEKALHCLGQLLRSISDLDSKLIQRDNLHKILAISICLNPGPRDPQASNQIVGEIHKIYLRTSQSLKQVVGTAQMAVDLLAMVCIARRIPCSETPRRSVTPFCALHLLFAGRTPYASLPAPDRYYTSFIKACEEKEVRQDIVNFINAFSHASNVSSAMDATLVSYFSCRIDGFVHAEAMRELSIKTRGSEDYVRKCSSSG